MSRSLSNILFLTTAFCLSLTGQPIHAQLIGIRHEQSVLTQEQIPSRLNPFHDIRGQRRFLISFPFHYERDRRLHEQEEQLKRFADEIIIPKGEKATPKHTDELPVLKDRSGSHPALFPFPQHPTIEQKFKILDIHINGVNKKEERLLLNKLPKHSSHELSRKDVEDMEAQMIGTGSFENISYRLLKNEDGYNLEMDCKKAPIHQFGFGIRFDTEEAVTAMAEAGFNANKISGSRHSIGIKLSAHPQLRYLYSFDSPDMPTFNAGANIRWMDMNLLDYTHGKRNNLNYLHSEQKMFLSNMKWKYLDTRAGWSNDFWYFPDGRDVNQQVLDNVYCSGHKWTDYLNLFCEMRAYSFDDSYFPTKGIDGGLSYRWTFSRWPSHDRTSLENFHAIRADIKGAFSLGESFTILPAAEICLLMGRNMPLVYGNFLGGAIRGRYIEQQIPFPAINAMIPANPYLGVFTADFRLKVYKEHYLTGHIGYMRDSICLKDWFSEARQHWGIVLDYSYNSLIGPLSFNVHWSDISPTPKKLGIYINMGFYF